MNGYLNLQTPAEVAIEIANKAKQTRLQKELTRKTLSALSGVAQSSIKRFETEAQISFVNLLKLANALDCLDDFSKIFKFKEPINLASLEKNKNNRARGNK